jgi:hypothetical protein
LLAGLSGYRVKATPAAVLSKRHAVGFLLYPGRRHGTSHIQPYFLHRNSSMEKIKSKASERIEHKEFFSKPLIFYVGITGHGSAIDELSPWCASLLW